MKIVIGLLLLLIGVGALVVFSQNSFKNSLLPFAKSPTATINNHTFNLFVVKTQKEKETGLSEKSSLAENYGMLFLFEKADYYSFWMKGMKFPIDIIYIKKDHIVTIYHGLLPPTSKEENPPTYAPTEPADTILEINAGLSKKYGFKNNDVVKISGF